MKTKTKDLMQEYAQTLPASSARVQCYNIANLVIGDNETIANTLMNDHRSQDGHLQSARLMVEAGAATEIVKKAGCYGRFTFEDGSGF